MTVSSRRIITAATYAVLAVALHTSPAGAMGRSSTPNAQLPSPGRTADRIGRIEVEQKVIKTDLQTQMETLRQELAVLKSRIASQGVASAE